MKGHLIFFDDSCAFCWRSVSTLSRWDRRGLFHFAPLTSQIAKHALGNRWNELCNENSLVLLEHAPTPRLWLRSKAILRIFWLLGGWRKAIGWLAYVPFVSGVGDLIYRLIARHRHQF